MATLPPLLTITAGMTTKPLRKESWKRAPSLSRLGFPGFAEMDSHGSR